MFILDNTPFAAGTLQTCSSTSYAGLSHSVDEVTDVTEGQNFSNRDYVDAWTFNPNGSGLTWKRMADGTLIEARDDTMSVQASDISVHGNMGNPYEDYSSMQLEYPLKSGDSLMVDGSFLCYYSKGTINGAQYTVKALYPGKNETEFNQSDLVKYLVSTGIGNWNATKNIVGFSEYQSNNRTTSMSTSGAYAQIKSDATNCSVRLYAIPDGTPPSITPIENDLGTITDPESVTLQVVGNPTITVSYDGGDWESLQGNVGNVVLDLSSKWSSLDYGQHTVIVKTSQSGYECGARITFTKSSSVVSVTTDPHSSVERPLMCRIIDDVTASAGANVSRSVTNNANDENPVWEPFTGDFHVFSNVTKTASTWGLAARVGVDNSDGTSNAEIKSAIALGVLYEQEV